MTGALLLAGFAQAGVVEEVRELAAFRGLRNAASAPPLAATVYRRAADGELVTGVTYVDGIAAGKGWAVKVFDLPPAALWMALNSEEAYPQHLSGLTESVILSGDGRTTQHRLFQRMDLPLVADRWWIVDTVHNARLYTSSAGRLWEVSWTDATAPENLAGQPVGDAIPVGWTEGAWLLVALSDGRTLAEYYTWSDPGGRLPAGPASRFAVGALGGFFADIERFSRKLAASDRTGFVRPDQAPL